MDCGTKVTALGFNQLYDLTLAAGTYRFFQPEYVKDTVIKLELTKVQGNVQLLSSLGQNGLLPTLYSSDSVQIIPNTTGTLMVLVDTATIGPYGLVFAVYCSEVAPQSEAMISISFSQSSSSTSGSVYIIVGVMLGAGTMCISCCLICFRLVCKRRRHRAARVHVYQNWGLSNASDQDKIMHGTEIPFDPRNPLICTICLDNITNQLELVMLPCTHVFHSNCISVWFEKQDFCCVCKATYDISRNYDPE